MSRASVACGAMLALLALLSAGCGQKEASAPATPAPSAAASPGTAATQNSPDAARYQQMQQGTKVTPNAR